MLGATSGNNYGLVVLHTLGVMVFVLLSKALPNADVDNDKKEADDTSSGTTLQEQQLRIGSCFFSR